MVALTDDQRVFLRRLFTMNSFSTTWSTIDQVYNQYGMGVGMSDDDRISEYTYINQQLRKYISGAESDVLGHGADLDAMKAEVENMIATAAEYADTRKQLMYNFVRDIWLLDLYSGVMWLISGEVDEGEVE